MIYEEMSIEEVVEYINKELLKGRTMKDIEVNDFGVNERVIGKRLARKNVKKVDGQFVLQSGSKMPEHQSKQVIVKNTDDNIISLSDNIEFIELNKRVNNLEKAFKEILCVQSGSKVVTNNLGLKIYSSEDKPVAKKAPAKKAAAKKAAVAETEEKPVAKKATAKKTATKKVTAKKTAKK